MVKAVFIQNRDSIYDDLPGHAYHFPKVYFKRVVQTVGDWVILYESSKSGGIGGYFAIQRVQKIIPDPTKTDHFYAIYEKGQSSRFDFVREAPIRDPNGQYYEGTSPPWQSAVRLISEEVFNAIIEAGMTAPDDGFSLPRKDEQIQGLAEAAAKFEHKPRENILTSRKYRDEKFREGVVRVYNGRCAVTGLELRNGGGRAEVQAAHIQSVAADGPDAIPNGIALSGTVHWMFDRGLISIDEDNETLLISKGSPASSFLEKFVSENKKLHLPNAPHLRPHGEFVKWHRKEVFHG